MDQNRRPDGIRLHISPGKGYAGWQILQQAQEKLEQATYTAKAGGGVVTATVSGKHELVSIKIAPEAVDPDDVEMLEDLIVAAINEANRMVDNASNETMSKIGGGFGL